MISGNDYFRILKKAGDYNVPAEYYAQHSANSYVYLSWSFLTFVQFCLLGNWQVLAAQFIIEFHCLLSGINFYIHCFTRDGGTLGAGGGIAPSIFDRTGGLYPVNGLVLVALDRTRR